MCYTKNSKSMKVFQLMILLILGLTLSCVEDQEDTSQLAQPKLIIKLKFDPTQERLGNLGQPITVAQGNAAQSPTINRMSANYIEFAPSATTALGTGEIIFEGDETSLGGAQAINFQNAVFAGHNETFISIPLNNISVGNYEWVLSLIHI